MRYQPRTRSLTVAAALIFGAAACGNNDDGASVRDLSEEEGSTSDSATGGSANGSASASAPASGSASAGSTTTGETVDGDGGYTYASDVNAHRLVTDDICDIKELLEADPVDFAAIETIYRDGVHSVNSDGSVRSLAGFATAADRLHGLDGYYETATPLDDWMSEAFAGTGRFEGASDGVRRQAIEKGAQNQIMVAWVVHELNSALGKVAEGDIDADSGAPHNWDEGWAFYHGASPQCAPHATADSRAGNFDTTVEGSETALTNEGITDAMNAGRDALLAGDVTATEEAANEVIRSMVITYSQAAIRYASLVPDDVEGGDLDAAAEHRSEGLAFFRVIEAILAENGADVAAVNAIYDFAAELGTTGGGDEVRAALQPAWESLGISDDDIGTLG